VKLSRGEKVLLVVMLALIAGLWTAVFMTGAWRWV
jgi:hypothetical protein